MRKSVPLHRMIAGLMGIAVILAAESGSAFVVDSLDGDLTANEINSFKTYIAGTTIAPNNAGNAWLFGNTGQVCKAIGRMYEVTGDVTMLDRMIQYADTALAGRNDPNTGVMCWTGKRELVWPHTFSPEPIYTSCESGEVVGHMLYCARLILETPSIWNTNVAVGDPRGYGATYYQRAIKYLTEGDKTIDQFIIPIWVRASQGNKIIAPANWNGDGASPNTAYPWNRNAMFLAALQRSAECHEILGDNPTKVAQYDQIVTDNVEWFLSTCVPITRQGFPCYTWFYKATTTTAKEEVWEDHGALDVRMIWEAYERGIGLSKTEMIKFANTMQYSVYNASANNFHAYFDGTDGSLTPRNYTKGPYIFLADYLPNLYYTIGNLNRARTSDVTIITSLLYQKARRFDAFAVAGIPSSSGSNVVTAGGTATYDVGVDSFGGFTGTVALSTTGLPTGASSTFTPSSIAGGEGFSDLSIATSASTPAGTHNVTVRGTSGSTVRSGTVQLIVNAPAASGNLALNKPATASTVWSSSYDAAKGVDGSTGTRWSAASGQTANQWLRVDLGSNISVNRVIIKEISFQRVTAFKIQSSNDGSAFTDISGASGTTIGSARTLTFTPVNARYFRLFITSASGVPTIEEFEIYGNLAQGKPATASTIWSATYDAAKAVDGNTGTRWSAASNQLTNQWVRVDLGASTSLSRVVIKEISYPRVTAFKIQTSTDGTNFTDRSTGTTIGANRTVTFTAVSARYVRLFLTSASDEPTIDEFEVFAN